MHYAGVADPAACERDAHVRRIGRRLGVGVFVGVVTTFTAVCSAQICLQVWASPVASGPVDCATGTLDLIRSVVAAREAASSEVTEREGLARFRETVAEAWSQRTALARACAETPGGLRYLKEIDRLRYAEEHAVRYRTTDLSRRRQAVERMMPAVLKAAEASQH